MQEMGDFKGLGTNFQLSNPKTDKKRHNNGPKIQNHLAK